MARLAPKYITFDCYGTLIYFEMAPVARRLYADRVPAERMDAFVEDFSAYRLDEVLGAWKPYKDVVANALVRTCKRNGVEYRDSDADAVYAAVPTWGPHPDTVEGLAKVAKEFPLVILSNSMKDLIPHSVAKLGAPFHAAYTAEEAQAYKPRMQAFEYMLDQLGCGPEDVLHCSSSFRYDLMTAHDMRITNKVFVNRGHEPANPYYGYHEIKDIRGLPGLLGL
ncbi:MULTISPECIES: haloacid dehalogenase type II [Methylobacterium]|jgi:2-haloacid dehalogenase|uniref:Dehalogenase n=2 Tax=Methylobacterium TaxID=407 RepID=A0A0C6FH74_9HYPH|nr:MULTISPECIES: haloacid dehalogenase type II [Methylobacterium]MBK3400510.1 haloacid dehalogenase type II [Methylobacterium ajmalii]MBK3409661.1 haloacid dehalogenase type II [Methylobacterium ajmalii]MBK3421777.1 haloacid dehalogenase type II [Methylobacterium ajmalii]MBZ6416545.1 haloacid dehalogenase type II [Methylobacterium sp.]SFF42044.1 2-haloacid dehalogenase [Methylobacterium sp. yr596]